MNSIQKFKNIHKGERVFIIGNGPSLNDTPLEKLEDEYTIAMNKINKIYDMTSWRPTYFLYQRRPPLSDQRLENYIDTINLGIPSFISKDNSAHFPTKDNIYYFNRELIDEKLRNQIDNMYRSSLAGDKIEFVNNLNLSNIWSEEISELVYGMTTSIYPASQIAYYMGFDEIYFIGCDLGFDYIAPHMLFSSGNDPRTYAKKQKSGLTNHIDFISDGNKPARSFCNGLLYKSLNNDVLGPKLMKLYYAVGGEDNNHFEGSYQLETGRNSKDWNFKRTHWVIEMISDKYEFDVYNATVGGELEVHTRKELMTLLNE